MSRDAMERIVASALRDTINQHGPVTSKRIPSAAKRIAGQILNDRMHDPDIVKDVVVHRLQGQLNRLRHGHKRTVEQLQALQEREPVPEPWCVGVVANCKDGRIVVYIEPEDLDLAEGAELNIWPDGYGPPPDGPIIDPGFRGRLHQAMASHCRIHRDLGGCDACEQRVSAVMDLLAHPEDPA